MLCSSHFIVHKWSDCGYELFIIDMAIRILVESFEEQAQVFFDWVNICFLNEIPEVVYGENTALKLVNCGKSSEIVHFDFVADPLSNQLN